MFSDVILWQRSGELTCFRKFSTIVILKIGSSTCMESLLMRVLNTVALDVPVVWCVVCCNGERAGYHVKLPPNHGASREDKPLETKILPLGKRFFPTFLLLLSFVWCVLLLLAYLCLNDVWKRIERGVSEKFIGSFVQVLDLERK